MFVSVWFPRRRFLDLARITCVIEHFSYRACRSCSPFWNIDCVGVIDIILPVYIATLLSDKDPGVLKKICLTKNANFITNAFSIKEGIRMFEDKKSKAILRSS